MGVFTGNGGAQFMLGGGALPTSWYQQSHAPSPQDLAASYQRANDSIPSLRNRQAGPQVGVQQYQTAGVPQPGTAGRAGVGAMAMRGLGAARGARRLSGRQMVQGRR